MTIKAYIAALLTVLALSAASFGQDDQEQKKSSLYQWKDDKGVVHIADDPAKIPKKYRSRVEKIEAPEETETTALPPGGPAPGAGGEKKPITKIEQTEEYKKAVWQERLKEWKGKLADAEGRYRELEQKRNAVMQNWGGPTSGRFMAEAQAEQQKEQLEEQMKAVQKEIDEARHQIDEVIPDEARKAGIPPGWLREVE